MENFDIGKTPLGRDPNKSTPLNSDSGGASHAAHVSHSPLDLGGGNTTSPRVDRPLQPAGPTAMKPAEGTTPTERVTGVKTFFTKLHAGAIEFQDELIAKWLKENPSISIKLTNVVTGEIQGKKTEPNIIVTIWY